MDGDLARPTPAQSATPFPGRLGGARRSSHGGLRTAVGGLDASYGCAVSLSPRPQRVESAQPAAERVGRLLSVNVGTPKDVPWQGRTVFTAVFKEPVAGRRRVGKLNVDGDGQGDLAGHGGEQRAVFVYQIDSYRYWERELRATTSSTDSSARTSP